MHRMVNYRRGLCVGRKLLGVLILLTGGAAEQAYAQSSSGPTTEQLLQEAEAKAFLEWPRGRFTLSEEFVRSYVELNRRLWEKYGIVGLVAPTIMMQKGSQGGSQDFTANEQVNALLAWRFLNDTPIGTSYFVFAGLHLNQMDKTSGADFSQSLGIEYLTSDSTGNANSIKGLLWYHRFPGEFLTLTVGQDEMSALDGNCRYACDDTTSFFSTPLSSNPTRTLPGPGAMVSADWKLTKGVIVETGVADALGDGNLNFSRVFDTGDVAYAGALKFVNPFKSVGDGFYKFTYYKVDSTGVRGTPSFQRASEGLSIQVDQDFSDLSVFAKYSRTFQRKGDIGQFASAGIVWTRPFGNDEDWLGLGFGWVDPTEPKTNNEYVAEAYYRLQLTPFVQVTPAAMLVMNPSNNPDTNVEGVFTLRARGRF